MKLLSVAIPCYNSAAYMRKCIDFMLECGEEMEIIIVNDGSKDSTLEIAREYEAEFPTIVKVIDKENGGHGSAVNAGLAVATGVYFRVCDSDDYLQVDALKKMLKHMRESLEAGNEPDVYFTNYVYDHQFDNTTHVNSLAKQMPPNRLFAWNEMKHWGVSDYMLMHSMTFKTERIRASKMHLPEHCFYVDEIYCYQPLPFVEKLCYLDLDLYWYFIGRPDQSVTVENMKKRYMMQLTVITEMFRPYTYEDLKKLPKKLRKYMIHVLRIMTTVAMAYVYMDKGKERVENYRAFRKNVKAMNPSLYKKIFHHAYMPFLRSIPPWLSVRIYPLGYQFFKRKLKLG